MTFQELVMLMSDETMYTRREIRTIMRIFSRVVFQALVGGRDVHLQGLGWLINAPMAERSGRNPVTGLRVRIPATRKVKFRANDPLRLKVRESALLYKEENLAQHFGLARKEKTHGEVWSGDRSQEGTQGEESGSRGEGPAPRHERAPRSRPWYRAIRKEP